MILPHDPYYAVEIIVNHFIYAKIVEYFPYRSVTWIFAVVFAQFFARAALFCVFFALAWGYLYICDWNNKRERKKNLKK